MVNKQIIRLTEGDLHRIIKESVNNVLNEISNDLRYNYIQGRAKQRAIANQKQIDAWSNDEYWDDEQIEKWNNAKNEYWKRDDQIRDAASHPGYAEWYKQNKMHKK